MDDAASKSKSDDQDKSKEDDLLELAKKEIMRDIKCAAIRAEQMGAHSWAKPQSYVPSKRFLRHMLVNANKSNERINKNEHGHNFNIHNRSKHTRSSTKKSPHHNSDQEVHSKRKRDKDKDCKDEKYLKRKKRR